MDFDFNSRLARWATEKNIEIIERHGIGFEAVVLAMADERVLDIIEHPSQQHYPGQLILIIDVNGYAWNAPFVYDDDVMFLKTLYPSRDKTKIYLRST